MRLAGRALPLRAGDKPSAPGLRWEGEGAADRKPASPPRTLSTGRNKWQSPARSSGFAPRVQRSKTTQT